MRETPLAAAARSTAALAAMLSIFRGKRRRGYSAKSPFANREQRCVRLKTARGIGSYAHHDQLVRAGLESFEDNPSRRSWAAWKAAV